MPPAPGDLLRLSDLEINNKVQAKYDDGYWYNAYILDKTGSGANPAATHAGRAGGGKSLRILDKPAAADSASVAHRPVTVTVLGRSSARPGKTILVAPRSPAVVRPACGFRASGVSGIAT